MKSIKYTIKDELGIHARPAGLLVKEAKRFQSRIVLEGNGKSAEATKLMAITSMGIKKGHEITVTAEGPDEDAAIGAVEEFLKNHL